MIDLIVIGAGGLGREVLDVIEAINAAGTTPIYNVLGVVDDNPSELSLSRLKARSYTYLGTSEEWLAQENSAQFVIGVGTPSIRRLMAEKFEAHGLTSPILVHPKAVIGSVPQIASGTIVCAGVHITTNVRIGKHVLLNLLATVGHDSEVGDYGVINPTANISGDVVIGTGVLVGTGAQVLQGITIGEQATIGASACVTKAVPDDVVAVGIPAKWRSG